MTVNPQITDAVTQGDQAAGAMGNLYGATAYALSIAYQNAVTAQQQSMISAQAATAQGVATLYSIDTASAGEIPLNLAPAAEAVAIPPISIPSPDLGMATDDFAYGVRAVSDAVAASLDSMGKTTCDNLLRVLQLAATTACLTAMIANPDKASSYEDVLDAIKGIV